MKRDAGSEVERPAALPVPTVGRRVRVLAASEAVKELVWYEGVVVDANVRHFKLQMDGLSPTWFRARDQWAYADPLAGKSKVSDEPPRG